MSERLASRVSLTGRYRDAEGGLGTFFENARVDCERCEALGGWTGADSGLHCPYGCGVRVVSTQAQDDKRCLAEERVREDIRRERREARKRRIEAA